MDLCSCFVCYVELKLAPIDAIWLLSVQMYPLPATSWLPTLHPYRSAYGIGVARKTLKWWAIQLAIHSTACL